MNLLYFGFGDDIAEICKKLEYHQNKDRSDDMWDQATYISNHRSEWDEEEFNIEMEDLFEKLWLGLSDMQDKRGYKSLEIIIN